MMDHDSKSTFIADFDEDAGARRATRRFLELEVQRRQPMERLHNLIMNNPYFAGGKYCRISEQFIRTDVIDDFTNSFVICRERRVR